MENCLINQDFLHYFLKTRRRRFRPYIAFPCWIFYCTVCWSPRVKNIFKINNYYRILWIEILILKYMTSIRRRNRRCNSKMQYNKILIETGISWFSQHLTIWTLICNGKLLNNQDFCTTFAKQDRDNSSLLLHFRVTSLITPLTDRYVLKIFPKLATVKEFHK